MTAINRPFSLEELEAVSIKASTAQDVPAWKELAINIAHLTNQLIATMRELEALKTEHEENCRIIGASGEREAALISENQRLREFYEAWKNQYIFYPAKEDADKAIERLIIALKELQAYKKLC